MTTLEKVKETLRDSPLTEFDQIQAEDGQIINKGDETNQKYGQVPKEKLPSSINVNGVDYVRCSNGTYEKTNKPTEPQLTHYLESPSGEVFAIYSDDTCKQIYSYKEVDTFLQVKGKGDEPKLQMQIWLLKDDLERATKDNLDNITKLNKKINRFAGGFLVGVIGTSIALITFLMNIN